MPVPAHFEQREMVSRAAVDEDAMSDIIPFTDVPPRTAVSLAVWTTHAEPALIVTCAAAFKVPRFAATRSRIASRAGLA